MSGAERLIEAVKEDDVARVRELLDADPGLASGVGGDDLSPVLTALYHGADEALAALREAEPELDVHEAAALGDADRVRELLDADPALAAAVGPGGWTPLHLAGYFDRLGAARLLVERGAPVDTVSDNPTANHPLHAALAGGASRAMVEALLDAGAPVGAAGGGGYTPLHLAASRGAGELAELLVERGADPEARADDGSTPAGIARERGHPEVAEGLG